ncbi:MAG: hemerythrin domain-containing protein [Elusimicrobia bacterium]|nr:hemerythrin domain-containing protein [Candidatus Liberimonas magnetica]
MNKIFSFTIMFFSAISFYSMATASDSSFSQAGGADKSIEDFFAQQHAAVTRVVVIYNDILSRLENKETPPLDAYREATHISRDFMQNFHEKMEEKYIFSRFRKPSREYDIVQVLIRQHRAGHKIVNGMLALSKQQNPDPDKLADSIRSFIQIYSPHKDAEDEFILPAFHLALSTENYKETWEELKKEKLKKFDDNFKELGNSVEKIEKSLEISTAK